MLHTYTAVFYNRLTREEKELTFDSIYGNRHIALAEMVNLNRGKLLCPELAGPRPVLSPSMDDTSAVEPVIVFNKHSYHGRIIPNRPRLLSWLERNHSSAVVFAFANELATNGTALLDGEAYWDLEFYKEIGEQA